VTMQFIKAKYNADGSITAFVRDEKGIKDSLKILGFKPYFYVEKYAPIPKTHGTLLEVQQDFEGVYGERLKRLIMATPTDVQDFRDKFTPHWEADIRFIRRFLIDTGIKGGFEVLRKGKKVVNYKDLVPCEFTYPPLKNFIDIECYATTRFPNPHRSKQKITCVTVYDDVMKTYITILLDDREGRETLAPNHTLFRVNSELRLLLMLKRYYEKLKPDVGAEWNEFDLPYVRVRARRYNLDLSCLDGVCEFDLLKAYAKLYKKGSNRLKEVAFDEGIVDYIEPEVNYAELWEKNRMELVKRNKRHVEWMVELNRRKAGGDLIGFYWNLKNVAGLEDLRETLFHGVLVDTLMLRKYHGKYVLPSKVKREEGEDLTGALVKKPPKGIFERVAVFDMSRYYPNIMIALNLTPEKTEGTGIVPEICRELLDEREKYDGMLSKLQIDSPEYKALKSVRNSVKYVGEAVIGYFGSLASRLYNPKIFNKVTTTAQKGLLVLEERAKSLGFRVLYYDTDGIYVEMRDGDVGKLAYELNEAMKEWSEKEGMRRELKLKCDRVFGKVLFKGVKKRLMGRVVWEDGKDVDYIYIQGFEYVRRDASEITRRVQREAAEQLLRGSPERLVEYLREVIKNMKAGRYNLREVTITKTLHKKFADYKTNVDYLRGAKYANKYLGTDIRAGDTVRMLYVKKVEGKPNTDVVCFMDEDQLPPVTVDYEKMIDRTVRGKVEDLMQLAGVGWERVMGARSLTEVF